MTTDTRQGAEIVNVIATGDQRPSTTETRLPAQREEEERSW